ncbi:MAG TPA: M48 family metalloprotease [bacterium]|nr:M48 family metalloprotease [bacterium]
MGVIHGLLVISLIGRVLMRTKGKKNPLPLLGLFLIIIGLIGVFFGRLIKAAVSRQREFLADAAAVQFTRNPDGIGGALKKIGGSAGGSRIGHVLAEEISHLYIASGLKASWFGMLATHPPLEKRVKAIDPSFDGIFPTPAGPGTDSGADRVHPDTARMLWGKGAAAAKVPFAIGAVLSSIGVPGAEHILYAAELIASIPRDIIAATRDPVGARALVLSLVMRGNPGADEGQFKAISGLVDEGVIAKMRELLPEVRKLGPRYSLPLLDLSVPSLSRLSPKFYEWFCAAVGVLVDADGKMDLFELMLQQVLIRDLDMRVRKKPAPPVRFNSAKQVADECSVLLSLVARSGHADAAKAEAAFKAGCEKLGVNEGCVALASDAPALQAAVEAISKLAETTPEVKKRIVAAASACVGFDGEISVDEAELLRAVSAGLDVPIPPVIASPT